MFRHVFKKPSSDDLKSKALIKAVKKNDNEEAKRLIEEEHASLLRNDCMYILFKAVENNNPIIIALSNAMAKLRLACVILSLRPLKKGARVSKPKMINSTPAVVNALIWLRVVGSKLLIGRHLFLKLKKRK